MHMLEFRSWWNVTFADAEDLGDLALRAVVEVEQQGAKVERLAGRMSPAAGGCWSRSWSLAVASAMSLDAFVQRHRIVAPAHDCSRTWLIATF